MSDSIDKPFLSRVPSAESLADDTRLFVVDGNPSGTAKKEAKTITRAQLQSFVESLIPPPPVENPPFDIGVISGINSIDYSDGDRQYCIMDGNTTFSIPEQSIGDEFELWGYNAKIGDLEESGDISVTLGAAKPNSDPNEDTITIESGEFFYAKYIFMFGQWNMVVLSTGVLVVPL
jgi:hypothetical protein